MALAADRCAPEAARPVHRERVRICAVAETDRRSSSYWCARTGAVTHCGGFALYTSPVTVMSVRRAAAPSPARADTSAPAPRRDISVPIGTPRTNQGTTASRRTDERAVYSTVE